MELCIIDKKDIKKGYKERGNDGKRKDHENQHHHTRKHVGKNQDSGSDGKNSVYGNCEKGIERIPGKKSWERERLKVLEEVEKGRAPVHPLR